MRNLYSYVIDNTGDINNPVRDGFFGSRPGSFHTFGIEHFIPLILLGISIFLVIFFSKKLKEWKHEPKLRIIFAVLMLISEMSYFWRLLYTRNGNVRDHLPITVCGIATIMCSICLMTKTKFLFEISYFWVLGSSLLALIMPTVISETGPEFFRYYQFWFQHSSIFIAVFYMIFVFKWRPTWFSMAKAAAAFTVLLGLAFLVNASIAGANYLFIGVVDEGNPILNALPPYMWVRTIIMFLFISVLYFLSYVPWMAIDIHAKRKHQELSIAE